VREANDPPSVDGGTGEPPDVFELASNDTRLDVLRALAGALHESPGDPWLAYSTLREEAGVRDKGNFNYHLDRLEGLVEKSEAGYSITSTGVQLVAAIASGSFDTEWTWGPVDVAGDCPVCGDPVHLRYADGVLRLECGVEEHARYLPGSPNLLETAPEETVAERVAFLLQHEAALLRRGLCASCEGSVDGRIRLASDEAEHVHFHGDCGRCGLQYGLSVGTMVVPHPAVISFFHERGTDVRSQPVWTLDFCQPGAETVASEEPFRVRVDAECAGDVLSLTLDREGSVVEVARPGDG